MKFIHNCSPIHEILPSPSRAPSVWRRAFSSTPTAPCLWAPSHQSWSSFSHLVGRSERKLVQRALNWHNTCKYTQYTRKYTQYKCKSRVWVLSTFLRSYRSYVCDYNCKLTLFNNAQLTNGFRFVHAIDEEREGGTVDDLMLHGNDLRGEHTRNWQMTGCTTDNWINLEEGTKTE